MNRKKMLPLVLLAAGAVLLGVLLAVLTCENEAEEDTGIPLVDFAAEDVDELAYSGNNVDVTLLKGSEDVYKRQVYEADTGRLTLTRYWQLTDHDHPDDFETTARLSLIHI